MKRVLRALPLLGVSGLAVTTLVFVSFDARHHFLTTRPGPKLVYADALTPAHGFARINVDSVIINGRRDAKDTPSRLRLRNGTFRIEGWAIDQSGHPLSGMQYTIDGGPAYPLAYGLARPDVSRALACSCDASGFVLAINTSVLPIGRHKIVLRAINADANHYEDANAFFTDVYR